MSPNLPPTPDPSDPISHSYHHPTSTLALVRCMVLVCLGAHWFACTWAIQAGFFDSPLETWMGEHDYCWPADTDRGYRCVDPWDMYAASLYFAMMTITSVGYGDISATPRNAPEQGALTLMMLFGGMLWSNVVATFCGVIANSNPDLAVFHSTMDSLNVSHAIYPWETDLPHGKLTFCCAVAALHGSDEHPKGHADAASGVLPSI